MPEVRVGSVIAKPSGHRGFSQWRTPPKGNTGRTRYGLCHRLDTGPPRYVTTLGKLVTGVTDAGLAEFWARALRKLRKLKCASCETLGSRRRLATKAEEIAIAVQNVRKSRCAV